MVCQYVGASQSQPLASQVHIQVCCSPNVVLKQAEIPATEQFSSGNFDFCTFSGNRTKSVVELINSAKHYNITTALGVTHVLQRTTTTNNRDRHWF